jgi:hypothetical protein
MSEGYKQGIDTKELDKLATALAAFIEFHQPPNPGIYQEIEKTEGSIRIAIQQVSDPGCAVVGGAKALLAEIRAGRLNKMYFRKPFPKGFQTEVL